MADVRDERLLELCHRVEALEAALRSAHQRPDQGPARSGARLARGCLGLLMVSTGWVMAQTPIPGEAQNPAAPASTVIQKGQDGITRVAAPFQVVDPSGKVVLSVAASDNSAAGTSISLMSGGGGITTYSSKGTPLTIAGSHPSGHGIFVAADTSGKHRAIVHGDSGGYQTLNEAGKQVALSGSFNGKGVIGIYSDRSQRLAVLSEAPTGGGELTVFDKGHTRTALLGADAAGGLLQLHGAGKTAAAVDLGVSAVRAGAGYVYLMDGGGKRAAVLAGATADGAGALVIEKDGRAIASVSVNNAGAGELVLANPDGGTGLTANGTLEEGGRGAGIRVFNRDGDQVLGMGTRDDGSGTINVQEKGKLLVAMQRGDNGAGGQLRVNNPDGQAAVEATGMAEGGGVIVFNKSADPVATIETSADNKGSITIFEGDRAVAELTADARSGGRLLLRNREGKIGVEAVASDGGGVLVSNKAGDLVVAVAGSRVDKGAVTIVEKGITVAELTAAADGTGFLYVTDAQGTITLDADGNLGQLTASHKDRAVATFGSDEGRGRIAAYGKAGVVAELAESSGGAGVVSVRNSKNTAVAGITGEGGAGAVIVTNGAGATLAQMGTTSDGRGEIKVLDGGGALLAAMAQAPDSKGGAIEVYNGKVAVANIRPGAAGGGYIQLLDAGGRTAVEAGVNPSGVGVVRAGPNFKCGSNYLGLKVPDCIVGIP